MRQVRSAFGVMALCCLAAGCVAVWGGAFHIESEDPSGVSIRYDSVLIDTRSIYKHADQVCAKYQKVAAFEYQRNSVILPGGSVHEISFTCRNPPPSPANQSGAATVPEVPKPPEHSSGSGYAIDIIGNVITNFHVIDGCKTLILRKGELTAPASVFAVDQLNDLAVVKGQMHELVAVKFRSGKNIRAADGVVVLGYPYAGLLSTTPQTTTGTVTALAGIEDDSRFLQISAPIQPGNSGGPLFDLSGNVVGTVVSTLNPLVMAKVTGSLPQNINFAIKGGIVKEFLDGKGIAYQMAASTAKLEPADVGELGAKSVVMIECIK